MRSRAVLIEQSKTLLVGAMVLMRIQGRRDRLAVGVMLTVVLVTVARLFCAAKAELLPEEAYYWTYWKHPALSYFDHPPMVAWVVGLGTALFGDTEFGVRAGMIALSAGAAILMYRLGRIWFDRQVALWATLLFTLLPIFAATGLFAFPDGPLIFFWLLTLYAVSKAITQHAAYWLLAGGAFGGALLSKYTAVMLAPSLFLFLLFSREHRRLLLRPQPWIALAIALLMFTPVLVWNAQHDWASFRFQTSRTSHPNPTTGLDVLIFWLMQVGVLTPMLFALFAVAVVRAVKRGWLQGDDRWNFAAAFFVPLFLVLVRASFKTGIHINWTAPAYLSMVLAATAVFVEGVGGMRARWWRMGGALTVGACGVVMLLAISSLVWFVPKALVYHHAGGWRGLGREVEAAEQALEKRTNQKVFTIGADKYYLAAELGFYTQEPDEQVNAFALGKNGLGYRYWTDLHKFDGLPAIAVLNKPSRELLAELGEDFERTDTPRRIDVVVGPHLSRTFYVVNCYGYHARLNDEAAVTATQHRAQ